MTRSWAFIFAALASMSCIFVEAALLPATAAKQQMQLKSPVSERELVRSAIGGLMSDEQRPYADRLRLLNALLERHPNFVKEDSLATIVDQLPELVSRASVAVQRRLQSLTIDEELKGMLLRAYSQIYSLGSRKSPKALIGEIAVWASRRPALRAQFEQAYRAAGQAYGEAASTLSVFSRPVCGAPDVQHQLFQLWSDKDQSTATKYTTAMWRMRASPKCSTRDVADYLIGARMMLAAAQADVRAIIRAAPISADLKRAADATLPRLFDIFNQEPHRAIVQQLVDWLVARNVDAEFTQAATLLEHLNLVYVRVFRTEWPVAELLDLEF